ncbi:putative quinol monooxygenase [Bailinhaonella thermotolerans]|uniref:Antibiotic biosynthesis monooxygenase n=1 Tax=Bailinhaonella thermotolerans TaxID=1070861 RepID=A0A3A4BDE2_9ACTN|nr:antibiotic biosynthesis monooxygenase family protein [Bailinhaonella thermotolerans]RJL32228.1 antibiotic biosynthesis monooxygenase [Bailinhaonella thermotolerans]
MAVFGLHAKFTALPGKRDEVVDILLKAASLMSDAEGCEFYVVNLVPAEPQDVWITEFWASREAHERSLTLPGVRDLIDDLIPLLQGRGERVELLPQGGHGLPPS